MYFQAVAQLARNLRALDTWLDKAESFAAAKGFDVTVLLNSRLAPDMQPLIYQVQSACDYIKAAAGWLSGQMPPSHADTERDMTEIRARIAKTLAFAEGVEETRFAGADQRRIALPWKPGKVLGGQDYLLQIILPNAHFHLSMAYAILRHNGVEIGKQDYLGPINWLDA
jgi:hypothetical protein